MISGVYAAVFALMQVFLTLRVVKVRRSQKVSLGDGGQEELLRKMRTHGNFVETVPMALILMLIAELSGSPLWCLHVLGLLLLAGRICHVIGISSSTGYGKYRTYGMVMTLGVLILGATLCLWLAWPTILGA